MKAVKLFTIALFVIVFTVSACSEIPPQAPATPVPTSTNEPDLEPSPSPTTQVTVLGAREDAFCYGGPGKAYPVQGMVTEGEYFQILGMNGDSTWFGIDPTAAVDPNPPHSPLNAVIDPTPPYSVRCWVFSGGVEVLGALAGVPLVQLPRLGVVEQAGCYSGPGAAHHLISTLYPDQFFDILALDYASVGSDGIPVDEGSAWFQVDPSAVIDPTPPYSPLEAALGACTPYFQGVPRCWVPGGSVVTNGDLASLPVVDTPRLGVIEGTGCYSGPGEDYALENQLLPDLNFEILAIDDDIAWAPNGDNQIDDDIAWFEVDPNAVIDPTPPYRPLNELSPQPDPPGSQLNPRCWVPGGMVETRGDLTQLPFPTVPFMAVMEDTYCYTGPGYNYKALSRLAPNSFFDILGIDDDIAWIDDDIAWQGHGWNQIDDDIAWLNIDPNAVIDPTPPYRRFNAIIESDPPGSQMSVRCWVPINRTALCGDLLMLPILHAPLLLLPTLTPTVFIPTEEEEEEEKEVPQPPPPPPPPSCAGLDYLSCKATKGCQWAVTQQCVNE